MPFVGWIMVLLDCAIVIENIENEDFVFGYQDLTQNLLLQIVTLHSSSVFGQIFYLILIGKLSLYDHTENNCNINTRVTNMSQ
jgi:hypothetical protein